MSNSVPPATGSTDITGTLARLGGAANRETQIEAGNLAESEGAAAAKRGDYPTSTIGQAALVAPAAAMATAGELIPQNRFAVGSTLLGPAIKALRVGAGAASEIPSMLQKFMAPATEAAPEAASAVTESAPVLSAPDPLTGGSEPLPPAPAPVAGATPVASAPPSKPGFVAQLIQGRAGRGMSLGEAQYAVDNPQVFDRAKSIPDAQAAYAESTPGLMGKGDSLAQSLNKTVVEPGDYNNAINKAGRLLNGTPIPADGVTELTPQIALDGVQSINQAMRNKQYTAALSPDDVRRTLATKDGLMDFLQNNGSPNMRAAAKDLFEAHVKDAFSDFLPQNKYGSTDAMRTMSGMQGLAGGVGAAAAGVGTSLATGSAAPAVAGLAYGGAQAGNALLSSPRVLQSIIQNAAAAPGAMATGAKFAAPVLANEAGGPDTSKLPPILARILAARRASGGQ